jgi:folate-binding protein YgfZ
MMEAIVVDRAYVRVAGPDAVAYLEGQLSQDIAAAPRGLTFLLEPNGKVCALLRFQRLGDDEVLLDTDGDAGDAVLARLRRFLLRTKAEVGPVPHRCTRVFGGEPAGALPAPWPAVPDAPVDVLDTDVAGAAPLDEAGYHRRRILAGVPLCGVDVGADTIPAEVGQWAIDAAVSFTKGCFTGQELVARIDSRGGNVPRPLRVLQSTDGGTLAVATEVLGPDGKPAGTTTSAAADVALAPVARRVEPGTEVRVGGTLAVVLR